MRFTIFLLLLLSSTRSGFEDADWNFKAQLDQYFETRVQQIEYLTDQWMQFDPVDFEALKQQSRAQLLDMLGLNPLPAKTDLNVRITSTTEYEFFTVENIVFESIPGLYVTANLYRPKIVKEPLPAILYVCGHATVIKDGYNYGAKANYQHHPAWYARNGYLCLILDTVQLAEIEGIHHGLYRYNRWWWMSRGYTPAGIEAWNAIRAVDYLISRPDVDPERIGMTGRSGGGATSWWAGALDERIKVIAPISGITDLRNHIIDGCVEGHCDCMYYPNTFEWDFPALGILFAPRPLLIANADKDAIFPLDGVYRTYQKMKHIYDRLDASEMIALNVVGGGHKDIQDIQIPTFRWFNHFLRNDDELIDIPARKYLEPERLRVLEDFRKDQLNTTIDEHFVAAAPPLEAQLHGTTFTEKERIWREKLAQFVFRAWPQNPTYKLGKLETLNSPEFVLEVYNLQSQEHVDLPLLILKNKSKDRETDEIRVLDSLEWSKLRPILLAAYGQNQLWKADEVISIDQNYLSDLKSGGDIIFLPVRGAGIAAYSVDEKTLLHIRRRYFLLGETLASAQTFDISQGISAVKEILPDLNLIKASGPTAVQLIYATLDREGYTLDLVDPNSSHRDGPHYLNVLKYLDVPAAILMSSKGNEIRIRSHDSDSFPFLRRYIGGSKAFDLTFY
ncbi:MAG: acetylxylan esterase [Saprospiraceae bacterium]|nr:acetylxylan esterase [Saprospiraceae bacterium]